MKKQTKILTLLLALFLLLFAAACGRATSGGDATDEHDNGLTSDEHEDEAEHEEEARVPNNGAVIQIISPAEGATFSSSDSIVVEVEVTNFTLGENGNHWHVTVDGVSYGMVTGTANDTILRGLEPGEHLIEAILANGEHQDLQDGDSITITIE